ncbi:MAG: TolC family protein [Alphaproteobacteria bacterium]
MKYRYIKWLLAIYALSSSLAFAEESNVIPSLGNGLTLKAAIQRAITHSPKLQSSDASRLSSRGERKQAGLWQNPELGVMAENIGGSGSYKGLDSAEITYGVTQLIEIGGKRDARVTLAERDIDLANYDYQAAHLDLIRDVTRAFVEAVALNEEVKLAHEQQKLSEDVLQIVTRRVDAAREPLIQKSKANVALATSRIALEKSEREFDTAKKLLSSLMGDSSGDVTALDSSDFYTITEPVVVANAKDALDRNPDVARWKPALARYEAALDLEKANAVPDPRMTAGFRDFRDTNTNAFVVGLSIPIPILNQNQGNIAKARANVTKTTHDQRSSELAFGSELTKNLQAQKAAYSQATMLRETILPEAKQAFSLSRQGYDAGKFAYLEVLDAERTMAQVQLQYIEALKEYHSQRANVERLTAVYLPDVSKFEEKND